MEYQKINEFLWIIFKLGLIEADFQKVLRSVETFYEEGGELPGIIDTQLNKYVSSSEIADLYDLAQISAAEYVFEDQRQMHLVSFLFSAGKISSGQAFEYLQFLQGSKRLLSPRAQELEDVLWHIKQDADFGFTRAADDKQLQLALRALFDEEGL